MNKTAGLISASIWLALMVTLAPVAPAQAPNGEKLEATAWAVADSDGGSYVFNFGRGGKISFTSSSGTSGLGTWSRDGSTIHIEVSRGFVKYSGTVEGQRMEGRAKNRRGREWQWWGVRQGASPIASSSAFPRYPPIAKAARAEGATLRSTTPATSGRRKRSRDTHSCSRRGPRPLGVGSSRRGKMRVPSAPSGCSSRSASYRRIAGGVTAGRSRSRLYSRPTRLR
jgi:hypothetical protein